MTELLEMGKRARAAARVSGLLGENKKNEVLLAAAEALLAAEAEILAANAEDVKKARERGISEALIDRLSLNHARIAGMAEGLQQVASLKDPVGELVSMEKRPNGLEIMNRRVPIGVVGMIYESRPNVTADAFGLCFKAGNTVILKGGSDALQSNMAIVKALHRALAACGVTTDVLQLIESTDRETVQQLMRMNEYVDVLIPRGGAGQIHSVVQNSTVPVIETGTGNCHVFVDESADFDMALDIIDNAKTSRLGVCNACESLVIHEKIAEEFLPKLYERLTKKEITFRADEQAKSICNEMEPATEEDFAKEYLDRLVSVRIVPDITAAIAHINQYNTGHSEAIVTKDYANAMRFLNEVDAAAVYVNASTRFTDGFEFGFGAEIGISTQKLHARGPMGLKALTTTKYVIMGNGQIR
ncbi:MAG: glutamate-5-semialdehyde dehydrogenase [Lachnospiraceae bacterium]|nr:glutamate-5-semialdehyde dehydrogenase [Lachnospiraceae bacterium]